MEALIAAGQDVPLSTFEPHPASGYKRQPHLVALEKTA
jgi:hypothetical protein